MRQMRNLSRPMPECYLLPMPLNSRQVEAFRALMLTGSTVRAAEMMKVTQPAVSRLLRSLQDGLGLTLFERRGSRLVPTAEALSLYNEVERSFIGLDRIAAAAAELRSRRAGVLRIAALPTLANGFLPRFVGRFLIDRPKLDLGVFGLLSHLVLDWAASGQCDLGFAASTLHHPAVTTHPLPDTRWWRSFLPGTVSRAAAVSRRRTSRTRTSSRSAPARHRATRSTRCSPRPASGVG